MRPWQADGQPVGREVEMRGGNLHARDFAYIQAESAQEDFRIRHQSARTQFGARILGLFQHEDALRPLRRYLLQMQRRRKSRRAAADDEKIGVHDIHHK
jgi:hypothetical protein